MAGLTPLQLCHTNEIELQRIAGCLYDNIEIGRNTYKTAQAIEENSRTDLTSIVSAMPVRPNDVNCTTVDLRVKYKVPVCDREAKSCDTIKFDCSPLPKEQTEYAACQVTMDDCVAGGFSISAEDYVCDCSQGYNEALAIKLSEEVRFMYAEYSRKLGEKLMSGVGSLYDGSTDPLALKLFKTDKDGCLVLQPLGEYALKQEIRKQSPNCNIDPILITGSEKVGAYNYMAGNGMGNMNENSSSNARPLGNNIYFDPTIAEAFAPNCDRAVAFLPGSISLLEWYCFENDNNRDASVDENGRHTWHPMLTPTLMRQKVDVGTPILGVPFVVDLQIQYDECDGTKYGSITYKMRKVFDLFKMPQEAFCPGKDFNFCMLAEIQCANYTCDDICTPCEVVEP